MNKLFIPLSLLLLVPATMQITCMEEQRNASVETTHRFDLSDTKIEEITAFIQKQKNTADLNKMEILEYIRTLHTLAQTLGMTEHSKKILHAAITELEDLVNPKLSASVFSTVQEAKTKTAESKKNLTKKRKDKETTVANLQQQHAETSRKIDAQKQEEAARAIRIAALKQQLQAEEAKPNSIDATLPAQQAELEKKIATEQLNVKALASASSSNSGSSCTLL